MMKLKLVRQLLTDTETLGSLYINGKFFCYTLEDKDRGLGQTMDLQSIKSAKVKEQTAIPSGNYNIILSMSNRFKRIMPEILNVKGFEGIRIHGGNTHHNTEGCILVAKQQHKNKAHAVYKSVLNWVFGSEEKRLVSEMQKANAKGEAIIISIVYGS